MIAQVRERLFEHLEDLFLVEGRMDYDALGNRLASERSGVFGPGGADPGVHGKVIPVTRAFPSGSDMAGGIGMLAGSEVRQQDFRG